MKFQLKSDFKPTGDQPQAIKKLIRGINTGLKDQVLLGVTGSGKTFTMANVIEKVQKPVLIISHNKTLAAQLYQEFRQFFPKNKVSYFVSYYDYYQPEAYIPQTDTYIEKETSINEEIDKMRLATTSNLLTSKDNIVIASVSCIYNIGSPREYGNFILNLTKNKKVSQEEILSKLIDLQYKRGDYEFTRGRFRVRGETIDIYPAYQDNALRVTLEDNSIKKMYWFDPLTGKPDTNYEPPTAIMLYPAKHYITNPKKRTRAFLKIKKDLKDRAAYLKKHNKKLEAYRLTQKVNYDLEMIAEIGYVNGIENYSRYFSARKIGDPPYTLLDYFNEPFGKDWLLFIDESHMTIPQLNGMYKGDQKRKQTLIDFGFRLPAALDNRPLKFKEFLARTPQTIYVSATPANWEIERLKEQRLRLKKHKLVLLPNRYDRGKLAIKNSIIPGLVEQLVRPTFLIDPAISIRPIKGQIENLASEIIKRAKRKERVLVTTLTKRTAEDLTDYLNKRKTMKIAYLHSDIKTLERQNILEDLRKGKYDCLVGINLLREGLDLPEVSLVAILDADKEGFLRSKQALIQTMGRTARHIQGKVIMYADATTKSMHEAIKEVHRRREMQLIFNKKHKIKPKSITKPIRKKLAEKAKQDNKITRYGDLEFHKIEINSLTPKDKKQLVKKLKKYMREEAKALNFELAGRIRDKIFAIIE